MKDRILILTEELQYLVLYMFCFTKLNDSSFGKNKDSGFAEIFGLYATVATKGLSETGVLALDSGDLEDWDTISSDLLEKIQICKLIIKEDYFNFLDFLFQHDFSSDELLELMRFISVFLDNVLLSKGDHMLPEEKVNVESLKEELKLFKEVFQFAMRRCNSNEEMENLKIHIQAWVCNAAGFCLLNWVLDEKEENTKTNVILRYLLQKLNHALPELTRICLGVLKASKLSEEESLNDRQLVSKFVEFLLGNLKVNLPKDGIQMLRNGMIFLIAFLMDPLETKKHVNDEAAAAVNDAVSLFASLNSGEIKQGIAAERNVFLQDFLGKINEIKAQVRKVYAHLFLDSSSLNCPRINILGLFDSIIEKLKEISIHFPKHPILTVQEELVSLTNFLETSNLKGFFVSELKNEHKGLKDLWTHIVNVAYQAERIVNFFSCAGSFWLDMLCLDDLMEEIKHIEAEVKKNQDQYMHDIDVLNTQANFSPNVPLRANVKEMDEVIVGFEKEIKEIRDLLIGGSPQLNIISISGMGGMGKTTLAKKVYSDSSIKYLFTKCAWCTISQSYSSKKSLLDILKDVTEVNDSFSKMEEGELAHKLRKCLLGQKYLIVMDDIWDVKAWNAIKLSFPDDNNASRIIFTSRIHNVVLEAKSNSCCYPLSPLSHDESWELLEKKLFHNKDSCPPNFVEVGKQMAKDCKGLPLAVVLVAGLLKEKIENLNWWKQIGGSLRTRISKEGCADIVELSYKNLPERLKPCFLYFGSFQEDKVIKVKKLTRLWVAEGFIRKQEMKDLEILAKDHLMDLVSRSLVIVTKKSSCGGIKACRIHDLLREFCLAKGEEENFFKLVQGDDVSEFSMDAMNMHYRVCIQNEHYSSFVGWNSSALHSLLFSFPSNYVFQWKIENYFFINSKFLQVLNLEDVESPRDILEEVTTLVLLRYLGIHCRFITSIPSAIWRLQNLETICLRGSLDTNLPASMWRMEKLRHIDIGICIPPHLYDFIPPLKNIQSFSCPVLTYGNKTERFLSKIPTIRKLRCTFDLSYIYWEDSDSSDSDEKDPKILKLDILNQLESLTILYGVEQQHSSSMPFSLPSTLRKLTMDNFGLPWSEISIVAKLPKLEALKLLLDAFSGEVWNVKDEEFLKLKFLKLDCLGVKQWNASNESFPCLEQLIVERCKKLEEIPSAFGNIPNLRTIKLQKCCSRVETSAMKIREEQIDLGNEDFEVLTSDIL